MAKLWIVLVLIITSMVKSTPNTTQMADDTISCHYIKERDALPSAEDASFSPPIDSIFFHVTSCRGMINSRQACAVESAAKAHPGRKIYVLFSGPITENTLFFSRGNLVELKSYYTNINFMRLHVEEYAKNTALEKLVTARIHNQSQWKVSHTSDLLRFLTMYKFGGLYLDTDMIVLKPFDGLGRNWVARQNFMEIGSAVVNAGKDILGQEFMGRVLEEVGSSYRPYAWDFNGPGALGRVLSKFCITDKVVEFSKATCRGFEVYNEELIYPVPYPGFRKLLEPGDLPHGDTAYSFHLWNQLSHDFEIQKESPFDKMAKRHCPIIRELYGKCFGF